MPHPMNIGILKKIFEPPESNLPATGAWVLASWTLAITSHPHPSGSVNLGNRVATDTPSPTKPDRVATGDFMESL